MPEWNEKKKQWETMEGSPISEAQMAEQKRTTSYLYDMYHLGKNVRGVTDPNKRGELLADLQKNLQAQMYGRKGLAEDYVKGDTDVAVEKSRGQTLRDVADISGRYQVEATKAGVVPPNSELMGLAERLLGGGTAGGGGVKLAGDKEEPATATTLGAPVDTEKKKKEDEIKKALGVLKPYFPGGEAVGEIPGISLNLFKKPDEEYWKKDYFR